MWHLTPEQKAIAQELSKDLQPFTITFTNPAEDATYLCNAVLVYVAHGNIIIAQNMASHMGTLTKKHGPAKGVELWLEDGKKHGITSIPKWFGPMMVHWFENVQRNIALKKKEGGKDEPH